MTIRQKALCFVVSSAAIALVASACGVGDEPETPGSAQAALSVCGNNTTEPGEECDGTNQECNYMNGEYCGSDCLCHNSCGNGLCEWNETFASCPADCPFDDREKVGQAALSVCGNNTTEPGEQCDGTDQECDYMNGEYCGSDCMCHNGCGNGVCNWNENFESCPADCPNPNACGEEICDPSWQFCCDHWLAPTCQPYGTYCQN